jgi:hypothetical protein
MNQIAAPRRLTPQQAIERIEAWRDNAVMWQRRSNDDRWRNEADNYNSILLALRDVVAADTINALDECDTAFAMLNICEGLTPQARSAMRRAWRAVQDALMAAKGPESSYTKAVLEVRAQGKGA